MCFTTPGGCCTVKMFDRDPFEILADDMVLTAIENKDEDVLRAIRFFDEIAQKRKTTFYVVLAESNIIKI